MRRPRLALLALALGCGLLLAGRARAVARLALPPAPQRIVIDARGPLALVEVTRALVPARSDSGGVEALLDLALPDGAALASVEARDGGRWRSLEVSAGAADRYRAEGGARGVTPALEPFDDSATYRLRLLRDGTRAAAPFEVRYRFSAVPTVEHGRLHLRFAASSERVPRPAAVTVRVQGAADVEIAGVRAPLSTEGGQAHGEASTRAAWEVSWASRGSAATDRPKLEARVAVTGLSATETALAFLVQGRPALPAGPPASVLFVVDRSQSVGLPGLSAERELARRLLESLPPSTRFDALFFDRGTRRLFPTSRPATREAIEAFETEMVPDRLQNGTDLGEALRQAGALLRREQTSFGPRGLLVLITDGALADDIDGAALDRALAPIPDLELPIAAFAVRPVDDEAIGPGARKALRAFASARGGVARELRANEIDDAVPAALADLERGGDLGTVRLVTDGNARVLSEALAPDAAVSGVVALRGRPPRSIQIAGVARGRPVVATAVETSISRAWIRPWLEPGPPRERLLVTPALAALVEPVLRPATAAEPGVKGSMDRMVIRNVLSLAYMPRARACYLNRISATPAQRDLAGRVRLAIDVVRGEVNRATIESSTLGNPEVETCLRESAFAIDVPRAARSDAPVEAILNLVFRPRTPERKPEVDLGAVGAEIDLVIEEMHRQEGSAGASPATSPDPTRAH
jgi:hypothetical protein